MQSKSLSICFVHPHCFGPTPLSASTHRVPHAEVGAAAAAKGMWRSWQLCLQHGVFHWGWSMPWVGAGAASTTAMCSGPELLSLCWVLQLPHVLCWVPLQSGSGPQGIPWFRSGLGHKVCLTPLF